MNIHHRIVAVLHILFALIALAVVALIFVSVDFVFSFIPLDGELRQVVMSILGVIAIPVVAICGAELLAGVLYLQDRLGARPWLIAFGVLQLINLPFGTVLGIYTLWALLAVPPLDTPAPPAAVPST